MGGEAIGPDIDFGPRLLGLLALAYIESGDTANALAPVHKRARSIRPAASSRSTNSSAPISPATMQALYDPFIEVAWKDPRFVKARDRYQ